MMEEFNANPCVRYNVEDNKGFKLCGTHLMPVEILTEIFCHADLDTLLKCQLVCKCWKMVINNFVWHKKTERTLGKPFPLNEEMHWSVYYLICAHRPFERNLVKQPPRHEVPHGPWNFPEWRLLIDGRIQEHYYPVLAQDSGRWTVEEPPTYMPELPQNEPLFRDRQMCFTMVTCDSRYSTYSKVQVIDLEDEGILPYFLDTYQPPIVVSEWYGISGNYTDDPMAYKLKVELLRDDDTVIEQFEFRDDVETEKYFQWLKVSHEFKDYGRGLRRITFEHSGEGGPKDLYMLKMAGACVYVKIP